MSRCGYHRLITPTVTLAAARSPVDTLCSNTPGALTVAWNTPSPTPTDYRVMWAPEGGDWLSYRDQNETERGNLYPGGSETSLTISGLTPGATYKVSMRARYGPGDSGPWSTEATLQVRDNPPAVTPSEQRDEGNKEPLKQGGDPVARQTSRCPTDDLSIQCLDFPHSTDTWGVLSVAGTMIGTLDEGDWRGDWLHLEGLEAGRTYRVQVFFLGSGVGGSISIHKGEAGWQQWDSNFDGVAIIDLPVHHRSDPCCFYVSSRPASDMEPSVDHVGSYTATLTDVTNVSRLVSNNRKVMGADTFRRVGSHPTNVAIFNAYAQSFRTGGHSAGYLLDRITAFITMEHTNIIGESGDADAVPSIAIFSNSSANLPNTKVCDLRLPADYEPGIEFLSGTALVDTIYAGDCADDTLTASTTYWVVFGESSTPKKAYHIVESNYDSEDSGTATGWSMGNDLSFRPGDGNWAARPADKPLALGIYGIEK